MKKQTKLIGLLSLAFAVTAYAGSIIETQVETPIEISAETESIVIDTNTSFSTEEVFRGVNVGDSTGEVAVSTEFELPADIVMSLETQYAQSDSEVSNSDTDVAVAFSKSVEDYLLSLSYTWRSTDFTEGNSNMQEIGLSVSKDFGPVTATLTQYIATQGDNNGYCEFSGVYSNDFGVLPVVLDFYSEVGYLAQEGKLTHFLSKISTDLPVAGEVVASPFIAYSLGLNESVGVHSDTRNLFFGGVEMKRAF
jgi:hypothetical protein